MAIGVIPGKLMQMKLNGSWVRCQMDISLNITQDITDDEACKPTETDTYKGGAWNTNTKGNRGWTASLSGKVFADVAAGTITNDDISTLLIDGDSDVEVIIQSMQTTDYDFAAILLYEGTGSITSFTLNGPSDGDATWDIEITGNGALTYTKTPVVVTP